MPLRRLVVGPLEANCYIAYAEGWREALVVDAGGDAGDIIGEIEALGLLPRVLFSTHGHVDHVEANRALKLRFPDMALAIHAAERELLLRPSLNLSLYFAGGLIGSTMPSGPGGEGDRGGGGIRPPEPDRLLAEGDEIAAGELRLRIIHVPGHSPGGAAAFGTLDGGPVVFAGDALFAGGIGRMDLPGGDGEELLSSIREKLYTLPEATRVLPGHGPETTIGREKRTNPFVRG